MTIVLCSHVRIFYFYILFIFHFYSFSICLFSVCSTKFLITSALHSILKSNLEISPVFLFICFRLCWLPVLWGKGLDQSKYKIIFFYSCEKYWVFLIEIVLNLNILLLVCLWYLFRCIYFWHIERLLVFVNWHCILLFCWSHWFPNLVEFGGNFYI